MKVARLILFLSALVLLSVDLVSAKGSSGGSGGGKSGGKSGGTKSTTHSKPGTRIAAGVMIIVILGGSDNDRRESTSD